MDRFAITTNPASFTFSVTMASARFNRLAPEPTIGAKAGMARDHDSNFLQRSDRARATPYHAAASECRSLRSFEDMDAHIRQRPCIAPRPHHGARPPRGCHKHPNRIARGVVLDRNLFPSLRDYSFARLQRIASIALYPRTACSSGQLMTHGREHDVSSSPAHVCTGHGLIVDGRTVRSYSL